MDKNLQTKAQYEQKVPYDVYLKKNSNPIEGFIGYLVHSNGTHFFFELEDSRMYVIVSVNDIECMIPNIEFFNNYKKELEENLAKENKEDERVEVESKEDIEETTESVQTSEDISDSAMGEMDSTSVSLDG